MPNKYKNKVEYFGETLIDISDTTAEAEDVVEGKKFYDRSGAPQTGSASIPSKTSDLINDSGFITIEDIPVSQEIDPTVPAWAKKATKPSYTAQEVGALPDDTYIPEKTSDLTNDSGFVTSEDIPTKTSELTNDSGFVTEDRVPIATSDLINDSGFVDDPNYIHTDNNYTTEDKEKLAGVESYVDSVVPKRTSDLTNDSDFVSDANYVHTDSNFTAEEKTKLAGIAAGATVDDHKWGSVQLGGNNVTVQDMFVPYIPTSGNQNIAYRTLASFSPTANYIAKFDANRYLNSKTPAAGDNSTKVATTAYVDNAVPTKTSDLTNDSGFITAAEAPPEIFWVTLSSSLIADKTYAQMVAAIADGETVLVLYNASKIFYLIYIGADYLVFTRACNDGYDSLKVTSTDTWENTVKAFISTETDPTVPSWAKASTKPTYTYTEVGAAASSHNHNVENLTNFGTKVYDASSSRTKNTVLAAPNGSNGAASFRALVAADIPTLTKSKISDFPTSMTPTAHNHAAGDINSGTLGVARGGTGAASFTANCAIISGSSTTAALTTRAIRNNTATSGAVTADTALITSNTLRYAINRTTSVAAADTGYTTLMARGIGLRNADTNPGVNGAINFTYE